MKKLLPVLLILIYNKTHSQLKHSTSSRFQSYKGLVMAGYQGWFNAPDDGANRKWNHYTGKNGFQDGSCKIDMWPDVSEYEKTYETPFKLRDSTAARVFSSYDKSTVDLHFKWMNEYGLDGVFVQRFVSNLKSKTSLHHNNTVLKNALMASRENGRAISVMYDLSGMKDTDDTTVINDWKNLVDSLRITSGGNRQTYLYHKKKPLVAIWGVGFAGRAYTLKTIEKIIDFLKNDKIYGGCSILLGVPTYWRILDKDADKNPYLHEVLKKIDIVQPWMVGRYNEDTYEGFKNLIPEDLAWCKQNKLDYVPVVFPGFSWHNMNPDGPFNQIPRNRGRFFWKQIYGALNAGSQMLYIAMFDEVDEGTAIFKVSQNPPDGISKFVTFEEGIPNDYYLQLAGKAGKMLQKKIPMQQEAPAPQQKKNSRQVQLTSYVDPLIGSGGHGHVFVGASVPFGAVQLGPDNFYKGWDWCSGYNYSDSIIRGFAHTHLSGTGIGDLSDIIIMPYTGAIKTDKGQEKEPGSGYASHFSHKNEIVKPGFYSVKLTNGVSVQLTASERVGFHQYSFPAGEEAHVIIDLKEGINDKSTDTYIEQVDEYTFKGYRTSSGWAKNQLIFFAIKSSLPIKNFAVYNDNTLLDGKSAKNTAIKGLINFEKAPALLQLKLGISSVSSENAIANIEAEIPHWNFAETVAEADKKWNAELSKLIVESSNLSDKKIFYTAMYHTMINPSLFNDHNRDYRGTDKKVYEHASFNNYSVFSLWDTYRAANPLFVLTQPKRAGDMINSMLAINDQQGALPVWHLMGNETGTMVGISSEQVIAEAYLKGIRGFEGERAFSALKKTAMSDIRGLTYLRDFKPLPSDVRIGRPVAQALELSVGDGSIALMAQAMGRKNDYEYFRKRGENYKLYYDSSVGFIRGKMSDGSWNPAFDPLKSARPYGSDFAEGNSWQYLWLAPQDIPGLISLLGGEKKFAARLDSFFTIPLPGDLVDLTGAIGQYAHGNEPSHHIAYLYSYVGEQWKTAEKIRFILKEFYSDKPDGIIGNEDCGQMSAWYVFSSLGFYPVFPASGKYVIGSPLFAKATIQLESGKEFIIESVNIVLLTFIFKA